LIDTPQGLAELVAKCRREEAVAIDTEFHGEKRYWPDLYLIQVSAPGSARRR
jgi:ribonuclease D